MYPFEFLKKEDSIKKELRALLKKENRLKKAAVNARPVQWKILMQEKVPDKVYKGLESAFCKGFSLVFKHGRSIIEKTMNRSAGHGDLVNMAVTTLEGVGLGAVGVGMPDIVLFLGNLLKGVYEAALRYGFDYESLSEQILILKMLETALTTGPVWLDCNLEVDEMIHFVSVGITERDFEEQLNKTASAFALDMLVLKFIQGLPVVGILGGAANPVYYHKIMKYVQLKYKKRHLYQQMEEGGSATCQSFA